MYNNYTMLILYKFYPADNLIQIQFDNSTYCTNESTGELCAVVNVVGCVKEAFDFGVFPLPSQPVSAEGMHVAAHHV